MFDKIISIMEKMAIEQKEMAIEQKEMTIEQKEMTIEQQRVSFAMKRLTDTFPPNIGIINPSVDCKTDKNMTYRNLMRALNLEEKNDVMSLATSIDQQQCNMPEFDFNWKDKNECESYEPFQTYLQSAFNMRAVIVANGKGLADANLFVSDIFTLRPHILDKTNVLKLSGKEPQFRFRIRGKTDLCVLKDKGAVGCGNLLIAFEIKMKKEFYTKADINRALREGVLQLIGTNADNRYTSPVVIVTALVGNQHYLLYLELCDVEVLQYNLCVRSSASLSQLIHFAHMVASRSCITYRFAGPPTPTFSLERSEREFRDEGEEYGDDISVISAIDGDRESS